MSRSAEQWQDQQDQENESGIDMHDCYHYHHPLKDDEIRHTAEPAQPVAAKRIASSIDAYTKPF